MRRGVAAAIVIAASLITSARSNDLPRNENPLISPVAFAGHRRRLLRPKGKKRATWPVHLYPARTHDVRQSGHAAIGSRRYSWCSPPRTGAATTR
jgi:hypothetical protein